MAEVRLERRGALRLRNLLPLVDRRAGRALGVLGADVGDAADLEQVRLRAVDLACVTGVRIAPGQAAAGRGMEGLFRGGREFAGATARAALGSGTPGKGHAEGQ